MIHPFRKINLTYRNVRRLRGIVGIFMRHGLYGLMERVHLHLLFPIHKRLVKKRISEKKEVLSISHRLRCAFEELGPTFIKLGQLIASRPDLVPDEMAEEFRKLMDEVPPFPFEEVKRVLESEFNAPLSDVFSDFDPKPVAAASIAQVHNAVLPDGTPVVAKVQRPHIERIIKSDIELMFIMAKLLEKYVTESRLYNPVGLVEEFSRTINREIDFTAEASNMVKFYKNFSDDSRVAIPRVSWNQTTDKILTIGRAEGTRIDDIETLAERGIDGKKIARLMTDIFFTQVFKHGIFHGDLHAGNIFVIDENSVSLVDFGIVGRVSDEMAENLANILLATVRGDDNLLIETYLDMGIVPEKTDLQGFKRDYHDLLDTYLAKPIKEAKLGKLLLDYTRIAANYNVKLPTELALLDKCIMELEGLVRQLDPDFNMLETGERYAHELIKLWYSPKKMSKDFLGVAHEIDRTARVLPGQIRQLMKKMVNDKFTIDFVHVGLENLVDEVDRSSNRISLGLIIAALIIGSSLIMMTGKGPLLFGFPLLGFLGYAIAGFFGLMLAIVIIRSRKF
ncbi:MAG: ubiquinone biosynthesis protein UbiB [Proteobacteria bacterium]|nr:ubiquinone biosynthesis protein UbiB [Pseudomonadota bacterium]